MLATVAGASLAAGGFVGGTLASFSDNESDSDSLETDVWETAPKRVTYTKDGNLHSAVDTGTTSYGVSGVDVIGPVETGFSGSDYHIPIVDGNDNIDLVAKDGSTNQLDLGSTTLRGKKSLLATATWNDHPLSVYYAGSNASTLYRIEPGGTPKTISQPSNGIKAALGAGDINGDGVVEFAFVDGSATVRYIVPDTDTTSRSIESTGTGPGSNNNYGVGSPIKIDGYGVVIPAVNGSGGLGILDAGGWVDKTLTSGSTAKKCPVFGCDFDDDGNVEIAFAGYSNGYLKYLDDVGGSNDVTTVTDSSGNNITVDSKRGVR
jgi:predicted ribosomally synthesized peptide with SipW-like signal peptide